MTGVGEQGKGMDRETDDDLDDHKGEVQHDADDEGLVYLLKIDGMVVVPKTMGVAVVMAVIVRVIMSVRF